MQVEVILKHDVCLEDSKPDYNPYVFPEYFFNAMFFAAY